MRTTLAALGASLLFVAGGPLGAAQSQRGIPDFGGHCKPPVRQPSIDPHIRVEITNYGYPAATGRVVGITGGPDGNVWFLDDPGNFVGRVTPNGTFATFPIPTSSSQPSGITAGPDGNVWFTEWGANKIGRITPSGKITEFSGPPLAAPWSIATGSDGNLWFSEDKAAIARITPDGVITEFAVPRAQTFAVTLGPDNNIWFTDIGAARQIGKISPTGVVTLYPLLGPAIADGSVATALGDIWFAYPAGRLVRMTTAGQVLDCYRFNGQFFAASPGGAIWFSTSRGFVSEIGMIYNRRMRLFPLGIPHFGAQYFAAGPDGNMWAALVNGPHPKAAIAKITLP